jgi:hypothetical protein
MSDVLKSGAWLKKNCRLYRRGRNGARRNYVRKISLEDPACMQR